MILKPKNWSKFQHYRDRCPPWIKLHRDILNDRVFASLPIASKALAPLLWLLASESKDGSFDAASEELAFRLHIASKDIEQGLKPLIDNGFFVDASTMLAPCYQVATTEREGERETERERDSPKPPRGAISLEQYLDQCKADSKKPIPEDHPVFDYAKEIGLPHDFLRLQWLEFKDRYTAPGAKKYKLWSTVFAKSVRDNWFRLWMLKDDQYVLTTTGLQAQKLHKVAA